MKYSTIFNQAQTLEELIQTACVEINDGFPVYWDLHDKTERIFLNWYEDKTNGHETNNGTIAFWFNGHLYVTRYTRIGMSMVVNGTHHRRSMYVPFSNGDVPDGEADFNRWDTICRNARFEHMNEYADDAAERAEKIGLKEIPQEILDKCFKLGYGEYLPLEGDVGFAHPFMHYFDCTAEWYFGRYVIANGVINFVAHDGMTYFSKNPQMITILKEHGYTPGDEIMHVQMAHGERFENAFVQSQWVATA